MASTFDDGGFATGCGRNAYRDRAIEPRMVQSALLCTSNISGTRRILGGFGSSNLVAHNEHDRVRGHEHAAGHDDTPDE